MTETQNKTRFWTSNICCIITGASKGFGREICLNLTNRFLSINTLSDGNIDLNKKISFVLISRDSNLLDELQKKIDNLSPNVHVIEVIKGSLTDPTTLKSFENALKIYSEIGPTYDHSLLIHNAGSLSDPNRLVSDYSIDDDKMLTDYLELNFLSFIKMTSIFLKAFKNQKTLVNITSLLAMQPYKGLALYGSVKAARDSFFRSVALEYPDVRVLNYAPGILNTNMAEVLKKEGFNKGIYNKSSNVLEPKVSAEKMIYILENNLFNNGQHMDFYDVK